MHRRTLIAQRIIAALTPALAPIVPTVGRVYPEGYDRLPMVNVAPGGDERVDDQPGGDLESFGFTIAIEVAHRTDAEVDALHLDIERALAADDELAGAADWFRRVGADEPERGEADGPVVSRALVYLARYTVDRTDPT